MLLCVVNVLRVRLTRYSDSLLYLYRFRDKGLGFRVQGLGFLLQVGLSLCVCVCTYICVCTQTSGPTCSSSDMHASTSSSYDMYPPPHMTCILTSGPTYSSSDMHASKQRVSKISSLLVKQLSEYFQSSWCFRCVLCC